MDNSTEQGEKSTWQLTRGKERKERSCYQLPQISRLPFLLSMRLAAVQPAFILQSSGGQSDITPSLSTPHERTSFLPSSKFVKRQRRGEERRGGLIVAARN